jgi:predicted O-linked N-acetylglucosamine transferase (SPINDLY family)
MAVAPTQQTFDLALQHHQAGRLREAERLYRQILAVQPDHFNAMHLLGVIAHKTGRNADAVQLIRRAIALAPDFAAAHSNLGAALKAQGELDEAIAAYRRAIALKPAMPETHNELGNALAAKGLMDEAVAAYHQAIGLNPKFAEAHNNLGIALARGGHPDEAVSAFGQALALKPNYPEVHYNLGNALQAMGRLDEAVGAFRQAVALRPDYTDAHNNLGNALRDTGQLDEALAAYRQAIALKPDYAQAQSNLGTALKEMGRLDEAIVAYRQAIALGPHLPETRYNLGVAFSSKGQFDQAVAAYRQAIALRPNYPEAYNNLGNALKDVGLLDEAISAYRLGVSLAPDNAQLDGHLLFLLHFHPEYDAHAIAAEHRRWNLKHAEPLRRFAQPHSNDRDPDRRLRIGYVSPDFRSHVIGRNLLPLFHQHDHRLFEIICYSQVHCHDAMTGQFQQNADVWRDIVDLADEQAAKQIREDQADILVDLTLHMANNRLLVFARRPAHVQVTFAGYPGSTGLTAIDYRLSDPYLDPPGMDESVYSEKTLRLPDTFWCYDPQDCRDIPFNSLPAIDRGFVTFGCLNNFCKISEGILALWAQAMRQVEGSRLLLLAPPGSHRERTVQRLRQEEIDPGRVEFVPFQSRREYLQTYHRIDVGLDSFPYNGHSTSLDSFWMGVPVVTLVGQTAVSRAGWSQLSNLGLSDLAAHTGEQFVRTAVDLARDLPRLNEMRGTLRQRMQQSPLMNAGKFARNVEAAYRQMWRTWCESASPTG